MRALLFFSILLGCLVHTPTGFAESKQGLQSFSTQNIDRMGGTTRPNSGEKAPQAPVLRPRHTKGILKDITRDIQRAQQSRLERRYNDRLDSLQRPLSQFGYDMLSPEQQTPQSGGDADKMAMPPGAVQDDYILQPGDTVYVIVRGQQQRRHRKAYKVDSGGRLVIKHFAPISAAGRTIADIRNQLRRQAEDLKNTRIYLTLHDISAIGVDVIGHVKQPGQYRLTSFHTVIDALRKANGIRKSGSLRRVRLVRRNGKRHTIDLYNYLLDKQGDSDTVEKTGTKQLRPGDTIIVPPIGATVAAAGDFQNPGIYELAGNETGFRLTESGTSTKLTEISHYTGGAMPGASGTLLRMHLDEKGQERIHATKSQMDDITLYNGDILMLRAQTPQRTDNVRITGHVSSPGLYSLSEAGSLSRLIDKPALLKPETYPLFAVVKRYDPSTMAVKYKTFSPLAIKKGRSDMRLQSGDRVIFFSISDIRHSLHAKNAGIAQDDTMAGKNNNRNKGTGTGQGKNNLTTGIYGRAKAMTRTNREHSNITARDSKTKPMRPGIRVAARTASGDKRISDDSPAYMAPVLKKVMRRAALSVRGNVLHPGRYPVAGDAAARRIIEAAGGITGKRGQRRIEITSRPSGPKPNEADNLRQRKHYDIDNSKLRSVRLEAGDSLRVQSAEDDYAIGQARVTGAVRHPGTYDLMPGDTLLTLIQRAGGLTEQAYPAGAVLSRESARKRERRRFRSKAHDLEMHLARLLVDDKGEDDPKPARIKTMRNIISELRNARAVGRITVESDPQVLQNNREQDVLLEDGDRLHMPKRPSTVRVAGEVLSPAALQFKTGKTAKTYIQGAGGFTAKADKDRTFIVYPDGSGKPIDIGLWNHAPLKIPPGSTIVVPRDVTDFKWLETTRDISEILSNVAVTALFADDIGD